MSTAVAVPATASSTTSEASGETPALPDYAPNSSNFSESLPVVVEIVCFGCWKMGQDYGIRGGPFSLLTLYSRYDEEKLLH